MPLGGGGGGGRGGGLQQCFKEEEVVEEGGEEDYWGPPELWYQFLRIHHKYLLVHHFLKVPCPQTMVPAALVAQRTT